MSVGHRSQRTWLLAPTTERTEGCTHCEACGGSERSWALPLVPEGNRASFCFWACRGCGTVHTESRPSARSLSSYYARASPANLEGEAESAVGGLRELLRAGGKVYGLWRWNTTSRMARQLGPHPTIVEVGCGEGGLSRRLASEGASVTAIDVARHPSWKEADGVRYLQAGTPRVLTHVARADMVIAHHVIEHVPDPVGFLRDCQVVLRPGGVLLLTTPWADSAQFRAFRECWALFQYVEHPHLFSSGGLERMLTSNGFTDVELRPIVHDFPGELGKSAICRLEVRLGQFDSRGTQLLTLLLTPPTLIAKAAPRWRSTIEVRARKVDA
ncbi:MAG: class I SAM-dependent methyltransferase [Thermoplasmata archaeon]|nr:class I SAM-dependent methyltransferase [Thermoplasmata archaeon]